MMGIYIEWMDMPKKGEMLHINIYPDGKVAHDFDLECKRIATAYQVPAHVRPVVRGKWRLYSPLTDTYECDKCGYQVIDESFRTNFCPNCGADMREKP